MKKLIHREPLTSDIIFKAVFGQDIPESKAALIELLNLILERKDDPIVDLTYINPFSIAEAEKEKVIVMDIKVTTDGGELIDIEMQIEQLDTYADRSLFYGCKQLTKGLERGEDYDKMKKSIVISFIKTRLFPQEVPMHSVFTMKENTMGRQLSGLLELHFIELGKIDWKCRDPEQLQPLEQIGAYIRCSGEQKEADFVEKLVEKGERVISMADTVLRKISEEERLQAIREDREMAQLMIRMEKAASWDKGLAQGLAQGLEQGHAEAVRETAKKMLAENIAKSVISKVTGLSAEEIEAL